MKKFLLGIVLCASMSAFSQIEVIKPTKEIQSRISYAYIEKDGKTQYNFFYKNMNSAGHEYISFSFRNTGGDYDKLYEVIQQGFKEAPRDPLRIKANGQLVLLKYIKEDGTVKLQFQQFEEGNEEQSAVSKLFSSEDMKALFKK